MNIIFMGTPEFAAVSLRLLAENRKVSAVVSMPDKPAGRGGRVSPSAVKKLALDLSIPVFQPESPGELNEEFKRIKPDAVCVVAYGKIIPRDLLATAPGRFINLHASLLPRYRGASPINRAVMAGDRKTGVTTMLINDKLDSGDILLKREVAIGDDENSEQLARRLAGEGARLMAETLSSVESGTARPEPQDDSLATYAPVLKKEDGRIDWAKPPEEIRNLIRGTFPWPGAFTVLGGKMLKIKRAVLSGGSGKPGEVLICRDRLIIAAGEGAIEVEELQLEGRKSMPAGDFLRGVKVEAGEKVG